MKSGVNTARTENRLSEQGCCLGMMANGTKSTIAPTVTQRWMVMGMAKFVEVLGSVISLSAIKKVSTEYYNGTNYGNKWIHNICVEYCDGKIDKFSTTDITRAKQDYEGLKNALLGVKEDDFCSYGERREGE